ncbi:MAG TPA: peptidylprolyl isomerase [Gemmataceae bacterium]|nr:peptidylprolyl isomerase [Gemmataceae bacterium]
MSVCPRTIGPKNVRKSRRPGAVRRAAERSVLEHLESRQLLSATVTTPLTAVSGDPGTTSSSIDLSSHFDDPTIGSHVLFTTDLGDIELQLDDQQKPITVANFLNYVRSGRYDGTIVHRKTDLMTDGLGVIQGGGYKLPLSSVNHITTDAPIQNEFTTNGINHNVAGTIAMAKTTDPNSATSEWFINTVDNSTALDNPQNSGGFTVFGTVVNNTMSTVDAVSALNDIVWAPPGTTAQTSPFGQLPVRNYSPADQAANKTPDNTNVVSILSASVMSKLTFTAASSNPALVMPVISGSNMVLQYGQGTGTATITVTATGMDNVPVTGKFTAGVGLLAVNLGGTSGAKVVTFKDADGTDTKIALKGSGAATVSFSGTGLTQTSSKGTVAVAGTNVAAADISATGTDAKTSIAIAGRGGDNNVTLGGISTDGPAKSISARNTILGGNLTTGGALGSLLMGAVDGGTVQIGGAASDKPASAIVIGAGMDANITSAPAIKSLRTASFASSDMTLETITAPAVGSIATTSDLAENVTVAGPVKSIKVGGNLTGTVAADSIGMLAVRGDVSNANIQLNQAFSAKGRDLGVFNVGGTIANTVLRSTGNIGTVTADSLNASTIFAGVDPATTGLPLAASEFTSAATLQQLKLKTGYTASNVAAKNLGKLSVGTLQTNNSGQRFGFAADKIALLTGSTGPAVKFALKKLDTPADLQAQSQGLDLGDAQITLV